MEVNDTKTRSRSLSTSSLPEIHLSTSAYEDDVEKIEALEADTKRANEDAPSIQHRDSDNTLVEAALDQVDTKTRHIRFQDHVVESAALVNRMLSLRQHPSRHSASENGSELFGEEEEAREEIDTQYGGSVLASLMKLEAQRRQTPVNRPSDKKASKKSRLSKSISASSLTLNDPNKPAKRPTMGNRSSSWLSAMTSSQHLVPRLEKRKKTGAHSVSRRNSADSAFTTASQFEPITLEDRIRITFEIANILQKQEFLRKLAKSLMLYGCPAHRIEYAMRQVSRTLGVDGEYVYMPNVMFLTFFDQATHTTETHFIRQPQTFEMYKLSEIYRLEKLVAYGEVSVDEALEFIDQVMDEPSIYPRWLKPFVYALASFTGCVMFFGGRWKEGGVAAALAMVFAMYETFSGRLLSFQPIWEITVCILIGFVAEALQKYKFCFTPIAFSAFIIILPGYPMAVAIIELVSRQLVSGVVRMVYAILYSFLLGYGISMGSELYNTMDKSAVQEKLPECTLAANASTCVANENQLWNILLVPLFGLAYCIYLRARPPRWPIMILVGAVTYAINYTLSCLAKAPPQILQVVPAFGVGLIGNLLTKFTGTTSVDATILGIFYLVPSILGIKAALGLFGTTSEYGTQGAGFALAMIESSIGITVGLFLATLIVYPKGTQHTPLMNF
ncbi:hypothetical protein EC973_004359 [Apophysomyces ossiformis]|uniref:Threonine/serine exporter-like N-terminal domain-containing protein n=1 Tax=Apophysomyces ossiformis TaxID=679940 RepID=A0A8H7BKK7_9FUNG|nr:hypothetical protein EC973_004359 [Apophysomyces ossiformis]